ncbi:MAG TPA: PadR family transcriptional regulator, partial [Candidatus Binatus sp.]|nr:PadR family transcriptional regulator [Candidatus Binatus sp.]
IEPIGMREVSTVPGINGTRTQRFGPMLLPAGSALEFEKTPPRMDVKFPILGFLMEAEATGYDLKQRFQDPVGFFYRVSDGSIYPALKKLAHDGLVTLRSERRGRRARKVYAITPRGRAHFMQMLREPAQPVFVFDESQVKMYFADGQPEIALEHIERSRRDDEVRAALLARMVTEMRRAGASLMRRLVLELGCEITAAKARVLARLSSQLKREIQVRRRAGARPRSARIAAAGK